MPRLIAFALAMLGALALAAAPPALAKRKGYKPRHHTHTASFSEWTAAYDGSATWHVVYDTASPPPTQRYHYDESSETSWHFRAPKPEESSALQVTYPTPCRTLPGVRCVSGDSGGAVGPGPAQLTYKLRDTFDDPVSGQQSISCDGTHDSTHAHAALIFTARYLRGADGYRISLKGSPLPQAFLANAASCPGQSPPFDPLNDWAPPANPGTGPGPAFWRSNPVIVPATVFAHYRQIAIPVSLLARHAPDEGCGLAPNPQSDGYTRTCDANGMWKGTLVLKRG